MIEPIEVDTLANLKQIDGRTPEGMVRLIFLAELERIVPVPSMTRTRWQKAGKFPRPVPLGHKRGSNRFAWLGPEIEAWIADRIKERDGVIA